MTSLVELRKKRWGTKPGRCKRQNFDAVYNVGVHNRSVGNSPVSSLIQALHDVIAWPARVKPPAGPPWSVTDDDRRQRPLLVCPLHCV